MGWRVLVVLAVLVGLLPADVTAQMPGNARVPGISTRPNPSPPPQAPTGPSSRPSMRPQARSSAPPSNLLPPLSSGPNPIMRPAGPGDVFRAGRGTYGRLSALRGSPYYGAFGYSVYGDGGYLPYVSNVPDEPVALRDGRVNLSVSPASAQVFVDSFYEGTVADFQDRGLWLEPGPRRIELRADGYETVTFDVRITEDQTVNYRRDLERGVARSEAPRVAATPKTFFVIPGCYAGDVLPNEGRLPSGCSSKNLRTIPPVVSSLTRR